ASAVIEPLNLIAGNSVYQWCWDDVTRRSGILHITGQARQGDARVHFSVEVDLPEEGEPVRLHWRVSFAGAPFTGALMHNVTLPGVESDPKRVDLPSIHYAANSYGTGLFPRPDPSRGFAFRADRLAQPAIHYYAPDATWSYFAADEAANPAQPELLYSLGIEPVVGEGRSVADMDGGPAMGDSRDREAVAGAPHLMGAGAEIAADAGTGDIADVQGAEGVEGKEDEEGEEAGLRLFFRYPQREYGHDAGGPDAYVAKNLFVEGENAETTWQPGDTLEKALYLWCRPVSLGQDYGAAARYLWRLAYSANKAPATSSLFWNAGQHIRWFNARLFNRHIGGGQYESPEGSGTAMLGFVEQSLLMAATTYNYASLALDCATPPLPVQELQRLREQARGAMTRWVREGRSPEGILYPACDKDGYFFGWRDYGDYENLTITRDEAFDAIRVATEARSLLAAGGRARMGGDASSDVTAWEEAALGIADWLLEHPLPTGGYSSRYRRTGEAVDPFAGGTGAALSLFCDCARLMYDRASRTAESYLQAAEDAYSLAFAGMVRAGVFAGGTLDASTPDREAAIAALDACIQLYELTASPTYLHDAEVAAGNLLSYTMVYSISTFATESDAARMGISTFGSSIVSPENQHLDPVSSSPCLLLYGLYADDQVCAQAGAESLRWTLDGRWAIQEKEGLKQSEQLLNTRWYYNTFFTKRGDYRRGMPLWGRTDSEHGWPQVVPTAALLGTGQLFVDWHTGRAAAVDGWSLDSAHKEGEDWVSLELSVLPLPAEQQASGIFLKVARLPIGSTLTLTLNGTKLKLPSSHLGHGRMLDTAGSDKVSLTINLDAGAQR
ncbi:MAG: hypothetical protein M3014_01675, partial [Chloroflexota bacterium]|nr:hypothetical protein [Chloroflexota bacterium]